MTPYIYHGKVIKVIDGDTVDVLVDLGFSIVTKIRFRLNGIDTPEKTSRNPGIKQLAFEATDYVTASVEGKEVKLKTYNKDKYGRYLCDIYVEGSSTSINEELISAGLAKGYLGGNKDGVWE